jgi:hypothetical protein
MTSAPRGRSSVLFGLASTIGYVVLACLLTWPLPARMATHLPGPPSGDTGVYVWNLWIFSHELTVHRRLPFSTDHVFAYTDGTDFSLHNYTPLAGLVGTPVINRLGVVETFNAILLLALITSALGVLALARQIGLSRPLAWLAGAVFMSSPVLTARETAHFSLVTAAALPLFLAALLRTLDTRRYRDAIVTGVLVAAAAYSDVYYGVYCVIMGAVAVGWRFTRVELRRPAGARTRGVRVLDALLIVIGGLVALRVISGITVLTIGQLRLDVESLYSPMLLLLILVGARLWLTWRPRWRLEDPERVLPILLRRGAASVAVCLLLLLPLIVGIALSALEGRMAETPIYWRSSPRGVDLLAYFVPNPSNPWFGGHTHDWLLPPAGDAFPEFVASFSLAAWALVGVAMWRGGLPRFWVAFTAVFILLSLGPFVHAAGVNTRMIGPWALLRYVPVVGLARSPSRFAIVAALGLSVLFAFALQWCLSTGRRTRTVLAGVIIAAVALEVAPAPRMLYAAEIPRVYQFLPSNDERAGVLDLPTGIRDGASSLGDFNASRQFFQTRHRHALIGGYLSRVPESRKQENRRSPILRGLFALSEGLGPLPPEWLGEARASRERFLARSCVRYVVLEKRRASADLRTFAVDVLGLSTIYEDEQFELLVPDNPPVCLPPRQRQSFSVRRLLRMAVRPLPSVARPE